MTRNATDDENEPEPEYWFETLPVRYVVKIADDRVASDFENIDGVEEHRFLGPALDAKRSWSRAADQPYGAWDVQRGEFVYSMQDDDAQKRDGRCPVCGDEYDSRREGEITTYNHEEWNPDWNADDPFSGPTRVRTCEIPCEDDPWSPDDWEVHLEIQEEKAVMQELAEYPEPPAD